MSIKAIAVTAGIAGVLALGASACQGSVTKAAPAANGQPTASAAPKAARLSGPVGTTYEVTADGSKYRVTLLHFQAYAQADNEFDRADAGSHLASAKFRITGITGNSSGGAANNAQATGTNSQVYTPVFNELAAGTSFNSGVFQVGPGQTQVGFIAFQIPDSVRVASIQWSADGFLGLGPAPGTWTVPASAARPPAASAPVSPAAPAASGLTSCGGGVYAGANTSCPFAQNVAANYVGSGPDYAYSPVTGLSYIMSCTGSKPTVCTGGNNALVQFWR